MSVFNIFVIAVGLAMDAFAASICQGLSMPKIKKKDLLIISLMFGMFQAIMPFIGFIIGKQFETYITSIDHYIAFILLAFLGLNMIKEALDKNEEVINDDYKLEFKKILILAIATSIDALAVGVTLAFLRVNIILAISIIGIVTFVLSLIGIFIGHKFGLKYKTKAELFGGFILIIIGIKILLEHLGVF